MSKIKDLFTRVAGEVSGLGEQAIARIYPALLAAQGELDVALRGMMLGVDPAETFTRAIVRGQLAQLKRVKEKFRQMAPALAHSLEQAHHQALGLSLHNLKREMEVQLGKGEFATAITSQVNLFAADAAARQASSRVPRYEASVRRYPGQVWRDINSNIQVSILKGETVFEATNRMLGTHTFTKAVAKDGIGADLVKGHPGLGRRYRYWAERLVRTETQSAYNEVHQDHIVGLSKDLEDHGVKLLKRWDASMDMRVCAECASLHGISVPTNEQFPGGYWAPPAHPNCRCCLVSFVPGLDK